jgi:hypothetical protein
MTHYAYLFADYTCISRLLIHFTSSLFSILRSLWCCCAAPFDPISPLSHVTYCPRDAIVLVTPIVVVTLLFSITISLAL